MVFRVFCQNAFWGGGRRSIVGQRVVQTLQLLDGHGLRRIHRQQALLAATSSDTVRSRIYSGKPARLLKNRWTQAWAEPGAPEPLPMPLQNLLVSEAHQRLMRAGRPDVVPMPVGQIVGRMNEVRPVAEVIKALLQEVDEALTRLEGLR